MCVINVITRGMSSLLFKSFDYICGSELVLVSGNNADADSGGTQK